MMLFKPSIARSRPRSLALATLFIGSVTLTSGNETVDKIEANTDRWIEIQSNIAKERSQWKSDKQLMQGSIEVLKARNEALKESLEANETASGLFTSNYDKISTAISDNETGIAFLEEELPAIEARVISLAKRLPKPLKTEVDNQLQKLSVSQSGMTATASTRIQSLVAVLTTIDQFNNSLTLSHEIRPGAEGGEVDVSILYWGLSAGFAVTGNGSQAWTLTPGTDSWDWNESNLAIEIKTLIDRYESRENPQLISLPATIK